MGSGTSAADDAQDAGREAATAAMAALQGADAGLVIVYSTVRHDLARVVRAVRAVTGAAPLIGASSSGQLAEGSYLPPDAGVAVAVLGGGVYRFGTAAVSGLRADGDRCGRELAEAASAAAGPPAPYGALLALADGMTGNLEDFLRGIHRVTGAVVPVVGGAAAADHSLDATYVVHGDEVLTDAAVAVWIASDRPLRVATRHGWRPMGPPMLLTKVDGAVVQEVGGRPATDVYDEYFRFDDPSLETPDHAETGYHSAHSFGLVQPDGSFLVRAVYRVGDELRTFAPLPPFGAVHVVEADAEHLLAVSEGLVEHALAAAPEASALLVFSCVARADLFRERAPEEAARLQAAAGDVRTFGFYTYGEFARDGGAGGYHNATITAIAL